MAHDKQREFCLYVKLKFPQYFDHILVLDVGSLDINGNNTFLFTSCAYIGIDLAPGKNVNVVSPVHLWKTDQKFDTILCTEMLEHDQYQSASLWAMLQLLKPEGLLLITAAGPLRREHGTTQMRPGASPFTNDFYRPITCHEMNLVLKFKENFSDWECRISTNRRNIYFWGIKK